MEEASSEMVSQSFLTLVFDCSVWRVDKSADLMEARVVSDRRGKRKEESAAGVKILRRRTAERARSSGRGEEERTRERASESESG